ncbi:hypothetical protein OG883_45560 [Streptomyces sp. NBC_01142]|uniref:hypothetical protein n=1 Tax=Streptomyces sp. NBC_01142 TaxID=2975865 RepID=UPI00225B4CD1|nr:hypothetical protein [Streptomyces sp. NBC_01142]MCX4826908.1 hypothetical protein [Streptomyces sp. NBC_01142]
MNTDPRTVGELVRETHVTTPTTTLTVNTVLLHPDTSSYDTTIYDDSTGQQHHGMRLGDTWIIGWGQQMGTEAAALSLHDEAVDAARSKEPRPARNTNGDFIDDEGQPM